MHSHLFLFSLISFFAFPSIGFGWGFYAHREINKMAVFSLPPEMVGFYKANIDYVERHAVDADKRRYSTDGEACKHYIDIDFYHPTHPFEVMPRRWDEAVEKFTEDTLIEYGILPWNIQLCIYALTNAFKEKNESSILYWSANIGHYVADSHVPLHTTLNYNGQLTGQRGIHGLWETRIPEMLAKDYDLFVGRANYFDSPLSASWEIIEDSFHAKDSVLNFERDLSKVFDPDLKYAVIKRGNSNIRTYSDAFVEEYNRMLNGMVERRFRLSVLNVACFWYSAWVNGGQPNLSEFSDREIEEEEVADKKNSPVETRPHSH
ncbi:MAG: S1/P1 Nuclease [Flavobacteriales bacterium]|nr:S1/P1 Nuclease [Flavobacteriales bacterium]